MVTTRIQTKRRRLGTGRLAHPNHRRRPPLPVLAAIASAATGERVGILSFRRAYSAAAGLLALAICYLVIGAQATQTSYELDRLKAQNGQLQAEQAQLRVQDAQMHTRAGVAQAAAAAGLHRTNVPRYATYQPVALDLSAPIGPDRPDGTPLWQRALAALVGGAARDAQAAGR